MPSAPNRGRRFGTRATPSRTGLDRPATGALCGARSTSLLDRIDQGLEAGSIEAALPDGTHRVLGGRGAGPVAIVEIASWRALIRLAMGGSAGWYVAWSRGEWRSPDPVPLFDLFMRNRRPLGEVARARGPMRRSAAAVAFAAPQSPQRGAAQHRIPLRSGQ